MEWLYWGKQTVWIDYSGTGDRLFHALKKVKEVEQSRLRADKNEYKLLSTSTDKVFWHCVCAHYMVCKTA